MSVSEPDDPKDEVVDALRDVRAEARESGAERSRLPPSAAPSPPPEPLSPVETGAADVALSSPGREELNRIWDLTEALGERPRGVFGRILSPLRAPLGRLVRFALGPVLDRQVRMNSLQVKFDNEVVRYLDERLDRMSRHYDHVLGLHGRRMGEIDERHLILQRELIRHVHDLVERIDFVFEAAEQNHLYLEGMLRESREELLALAERLSALGKEKR